VVPRVGGPDLLGEAARFWRTMGDEGARAEELRRRDERTLRVLDAKHKVVTELVEGRLTMPEAVKQFAALQAEADEIAGEESPYSLAEEEARALENVRKWVRARLAADSEKSSRVLGRLDDEWLRHKRELGKGAL
jgi:hypothetical protein